MKQKQVRKQGKPKSSSSRKAPASSRGNTIQSLPHASHREDLVRLNRIRGQVEGVERMISEGRYCLDIVNQIRSVMAALKSVEGLVLERHVKHCVQDAIEAKNEQQVEDKISELLELFSKR
jgi:CsoR family transcriptional regulator, copper-sensing transcriptional repressor